MQYRFHNRSWIAFDNERDIAWLVSELTTKKLSNIKPAIDN